MLIQLKSLFLLGKSTYRLLTRAPLSETIYPISCLADWLIAMAGWVTMISEYSGRCKHPECRQPFEVGDKIQWRSGYGAMCTKHVGVKSPKQLESKYVLAEKSSVVAKSYMPSRDVDSWHEVKRISITAKTTAEWREEPIPTRVK